MFGLRDIVREVAAEVVCHHHRAGVDLGVLTLYCEVSYHEKVLPLCHILFVLLAVLYRE